MKAPDAGGQAERRTAAGGVSPGPLNLIHRNNCSNPMPMRVSSGFDLSKLTLLQFHLLDKLSGFFEVDISPAHGLYGAELDSWLIAAEDRLFEDLMKGGDVGKT